ncbi:MAG: flavodoxin domain-containing protein [Clostridia bacterium]
MSKVAVVYWSGTGNTEEMATVIAQAVSAEAFSVDSFTADMAANYDAFAFGCPSMGAEELEDSEFEPLWNDVKASLSGKKVALFGSYGWGDGEWMRTWADECADMDLVGTCICQDAPDDDAQAELVALAAALS